MIEEITHLFPKGETPLSKMLEEARSNDLDEKVKPAWIEDELDYLYFVGFEINE